MWVLGIVCLTVSLSACQTDVFDSKPDSIFSGDPFGDLSTSGNGAIKARSQPQDGVPGRAAGKQLDQMYAPETGSGIQEIGDNDAPGSGQYSLNFENTDIKEIVRAVLNDALKVNYTVSGDLAGSVTLSSAGGVDRATLLNTLESTLGSFGFAMVKTGAGYRIEPAGSSAGTVDVGRRTTPGYGFSVIPLRYMSSANMLELVSGFVAQAEGLRISKLGNAIIVRGSGAQRAEAVKVVSSFDSDFMENQSVAIFRLVQARPEDVVPELERIFGAKGESDLIQFRAVARVRGIMAISKNPALIRRAQTWVRRLDQQDADTGQNVVVYKAKYRKAVELARVMNNLFGNRSGSQRNPQRRAAESQNAEQLSTPQDDAAAAGAVEPSAPEDSRIASAFGDSPTESDGLEAGPNVVDLTEGQNAASSPISISADPSNNSVVIYGESERIAEVIATLKRLDASPVQVAINVIIAEVRLTNELKFGVQYYLSSKRLGLGEDNGSISLVGQATRLLQTQVPGLNFVIGANSNPDVIISALDVIGDVEVLSTPSVVVLDNQTATLQVGDQVPITTRQSQSIEDGTAPIINQVEFKDTGIILNVTPRISNDDNVTMQIEQEISSVTNGANTLTPTISKRRVKSEISVDDQQTVLLGGLISESTDNGRNGVPGLSRMKILGNLFSTKTKKGNRSELIVLIRPSIIRDAQDATNVADELRSQMYVIGSRKAPLK